MVPFVYMEHPAHDQRIPKGVTLYALDRRLKLVRQSLFEGTCAAASLKMVFKYYRNRKVPSAQRIYEEIRSDDSYTSAKSPGEGLFSADLVAYAMSKGHRAWRGTQGTIALLDEQVNGQDTPVIVFIEHIAGGTHAVVVESVDAKYVYFKDPDALMPLRSKLSTRRFLERWAEGDYRYIIVKDKGK